MIVRLLCIAVALGAGILKPFSAELVGQGAAWRYTKGLSEASTPAGGWRLPSFSDAGWSLGPTPLFYGEPLVGTLLDDMQGQYTSVFLRKTFVVSNPAGVEQLELQSLADDGFIAWINGSEVARYNMPGGDPTFDGLSLGALGEPIPWETTVLLDARNYLVAGTNVLAIQAFNSSLGGSSDFVFDAGLSSLTDISAPSVVSTAPTDRALVRSLTSVEVFFSEKVTGVDAADLLINGTPATEVSAPGPDQFLFTFPQPSTGIVQITWAANHGIRDLAPAGNAFVPNAWSYDLNPNAPLPSVMISEFMANNDETLNDEDGDSEDWIEIFNPNAVSVDLTGWFLSNDSNNLALWRFPSASLAPNSYLVVFASEKNRTNPAGRLHTSFNLRREGGFLALSDPLTNVVSAFAPIYPVQETDVSYGRERTNPDLLGYFPIPTPGNPNTPGGPGFAPEVKFSVPGRTFQAAFDLVLTSSVPNAVIRYVVGKTNLPTETSTIYSGPIRITNTMQVRARAFVPGFLPGNPKSESYIMLSGPVVNFTSDLPVVILHNYGSGSVPASGEQFVMMQIFEPRYGVTSLTNAPDLSERARFRLRGSSTQGYGKGSFALETWNEFGDDKKVEILGMPEESDWVFYAPNNFEPALIHNPFMHQLSRDIGRYSTRTRFVEVYLNTGGGALQQANYNGIYVIEERIKRGEDRVDVDKLEPEHLQAPEVTGGYLLKIDRPDPNDANFTAAGQGSLAYVDPKGEVIRTAARDAQESYIVGYLNAYGTALNGANFRNPITGYAAYFDVPAGIDHHILNVLAHNVDALRLSTYLHKPREGKITFGPLWDFDRALGSTDGRDANPRIWYGSGGTDFFTYPWWGRMFQDIDFWQKWVDRWEELRLAQLSTTNVNRLIDDLSGQVRNAQPRELAKWRITPRGGSYAAEITRMKTYVRDRSEWIDSQMVRPPRLSRAEGPVTAGATVTIASTNTIYYTLDGTDPRLPGGAISPTARTYAGPITVDANMRIVARSHRPGHNLGPTATARSPWSGLAAATYVVSTPTLAITEIMYNPAPHASNTYTNEDYEFIEVRNIGTTTLNMAGFEFSNGVEFRFPNGTLAPGAYVVVVKNRAVFESRYGTSIPIAGAYVGSLDNTGERVELLGPMREPIADWTYGDGWHRMTDGAGFSLVPREGAISNPAQPWAEWRASARLHGSPGAADPAPTAIPAVIVTEALTHTDPPQSDFVEIANAASETVDVTGWYLSDSFDNPKKFRIPSLQLAPGQFKAFLEAELDAGSNGFALSSKGDDVYIFSANAAGELTGYFHGFSFGAAANGVSFGAVTASDFSQHFVAHRTPTPNAENFGMIVGPAVITELMFQPAPIGAFDNERDEYIEIRNSSRSENVALFDPVRPANTWRIRGGADFDFPTGITLVPQGMALVVNFDPALEPWLEAEFRTRFNVPAGVRIFGPLRGKLSNTGERIALQRPDAPEPLEPDTVPYIVADEFTYRTSPATYAAAGALGNGKSIHRAEFTHGLEPTGWTAGDPTPGLYPAVSSDADNDGLPAVWELAHGLNDNDATGANGPGGDPDGDGLTNSQEYAVGTHPRDAASALRFSAVTQGGDTRLSLSVAADRTYSILYATNLTGAVWQKLTDIPAGPARDAEIADTAQSSARFYRIVSPAQ